MTAPLSSWLFPASPQYVVGLLLLAAVYWLVLPRRARGPALLLVSVAHAAALIGWQVLLLLAFVAFVHRRTARLNSGQPVLLSGTLAVLLGAFLLLKLPLAASAVVAGQLPLHIPIATTDAQSMVLPMGASYCLFRLIHYAVEAHKGRVQHNSWLDLTLYVLFCPTFRAGPIQRFAAFAPSARLTPQELNAGLTRVITGLLKKLVLADLVIASLAAPWLSQCDLPWPLRDVLLWNLVSLLVYLDFSGYSDIAIGSSRLLGYRMVENFNYPYLKPNIAEYWRSWHISLHLFIRDHFFFPLFGRSASYARLQLGLFLSLFCSQIWHALSVNFALVGAYHGLVLVLWSGYERFKKRHDLDPLPGRAGQIIGALVTLQLVTAGFWLFFWGQVPML